MSSFGRIILRNLSNVPGWRTNRRIIVLESDDWGSIRMPGKDAFTRLSRKGLDLVSGDAERYNTNDTLENAHDLEGLFNVLTLFKDKSGRHPVVTPISVIANPDFEKIREAGFNAYYYELFPDTLRKYQGREHVFDLWLEGISNRLFVPEFHGREHLNVLAWMKSLQSNDEATHLAFDEGMWGFRNKHPFGISFQAAFDVERSDDIQMQQEIIKDGLGLFYKVFGYKATYFVPPNGPINNQLEQSAAESGIKYICAAKVQREPLGHGRTRKVYHYLGQKNRYRQIYITRNCFFEPSKPGVDWVDQCLYEIQAAFNWRKPAVISSHRVNYVGGLNEENRISGLSCLKILLGKIRNKWPDVEFMTSAELGELIALES